MKPLVQIIGHRLDRFRRLRQDIAVDGLIAIDLMGMRTPDEVLLRLCRSLGVPMWDVNTKDQARARLSRAVGELGDRPVGLLEPTANCGLGAWVQRMQLQHPRARMRIYGGPAPYLSGVPVTRLTGGRAPDRLMPDWSRLPLVVRQTLGELALGGGMSLRHFAAAEWTADVMNRLRAAGALCLWDGVASRRVSMPTEIAAAIVEQFEGREHTRARHANIILAGQICSRSRWRAHHWLEDEPRVRRGFEDAVRWLPAGATAIAMLSAPFYLHFGPRFAHEPMLTWRAQNATSGRHQQRTRIDLVHSRIRANANPAWTLRLELSELLLDPPEMEQDHASLLLSRAELSERLREYDTAIGDARAAAAIAGGRTLRRAWLIVTRILLHLGRLDDAAAAIKGARDADVSGAPMLHRHGELFHRQGRSRYARSLYRGAVRAAPDADIGRFMSSLAMWYHEQGRYNTAKRLLDGVLRQNIGDGVCAMAHMQLAAVEADRGVPQAAVAHLDQSRNGIADTPYIIALRELCAAHIELARGNSLPAVRALKRWGAGTARNMEARPLAASLARSDLQQSQ